jgi:hypothetical protein
MADILLSVYQAGNLINGMGRQSFIVQKLGWSAGQFSTLTLIPYIQSPLRSQLVEYTSEEKKPGVDAVCFSPNGKQLAIGHKDGHIAVNSTYLFPLSADWSYSYG